jgi:hypothetical protein
MNLTLWVFPLKAQQQATGRLQIDPDQRLHPTTPDT